MYFGSLRKQPSFFAPGPSGVSQEGRLRFTAKNCILMRYVWTLWFCINYHLRFSAIGHFRLLLCLCFKTSLSAKPFIWNEFCMQFHFHSNQSHFHKNGFALRLALKQRHKRTRKWPIETTYFSILHYTPRTESLCPAANGLHSHICTSCASNFRRIRSRTECFRNTGSWWDPLGGSKPNLRVNSHIWIMWYQNDYYGRINLYIKLEKHKLDQMAERNI